MDIKRGKYRHYKGGEYRVRYITTDSETLEKRVVYEQLYRSKNYPKGTLWDRTLKMFLEPVEVSGEKVPRFKYVE